MKLIDRIRNHPSVESLENELEDGWWAYLRPGWIDGEAMTHALCEDTLSAINLKLKFVRRKTPEDPL